MGISSPPALASEGVHAPRRSTPDPASGVAPARLCILPSPLLGPATYLPLAGRCGSAGVPTAVASLPAGELMPGSVLAHLRGDGRAPRGHRCWSRTATPATTRRPSPTPSACPWSTWTRPCPLPESPRRCSRLRSSPSSSAPCPGTTACCRRGRPGGTASDVAALFPSDEWLDRVTREAPRLAPEYFTTPLSRCRSAGRRGRRHTSPSATRMPTRSPSRSRPAGWCGGRTATTCSHLAEPDRVADLLLDLIQELATQR